MTPEILKIPSTLKMVMSFEVVVPVRSMADFFPYFVLKNAFICICMHVCICESIPHVLRYLERPEEATGFPGAGLTSGCELPVVESNSSPLEEQQYSRLLSQLSSLFLLFLRTLLLHSQRLCFRLGSILLPSTHSKALVRLIGPLRWMEKLIFPWSVCFFGKCLFNIRKLCISQHISWNVTQRAKVYNSFVSWWHTEPCKKKSFEPEPEKK